MDAPCELLAAQSREESSDILSIKNRSKRVTHRHAEEGRKRAGLAATVVGWLAVRRAICAGTPVPAQTCSSGRWTGTEDVGWIVEVLL